MFGTGIRLRLQIFFAVIGNCAAQGEQNILLCAQSPGWIHAFLPEMSLGFCSLYMDASLGKNPITFLVFLTIKEVMFQECFESMKLYLS